MRFRTKMTGLAVMLAVSATAHATIYEFGKLVSGGGPASASFASMTVTQTNTSTWLFSLTLDSAMASIFGSSSFVGSMSANINGAYTKEIISNVMGSGAGWSPTVTTGNGNAPGGNIWDFRFDFGKGSNKFQAGDTVSWDVTFENASNHGVIPVIGNPAFDLHVQSTTFRADSAWYAAVPVLPRTVHPVPEPETWALLGMGLTAALATRWRSRRKTGTPA